MSHGELVALFDQANRVCGVAPRNQVRRKNLWHGASAILVRNRRGQILLHQRTTSKDLYPGRFDFAVGGVLQAGEQPLESAARELAEEVGIIHTELRSLGVRRYADQFTRYVAFCYEVIWDDAVTAQPEEVAWLGWVSVSELVGRLDDPAWPVMPDSVDVLGWRVQELAENSGSNRIRSYESVSCRAPR